jgi:hypothetical protein
MSVYLCVLNMDVCMVCMYVYRYVCVVCMGGMCVYGVCVCVACMYICVVCMGGVCMCLCVWCMCVCRELENLVNWFFLNTLWFWRIKFRFQVLEQVLLPPEPSH